MILAQYTIRSKQEYIFRSNRLLDIVGGTEMIRDAFDWVYAAAEQEGIVCQTADVPFTLQAVREMHRRFPSAAVLVEDKANGPAVIDALKHAVPGIIPVEPDGSKTARAHAVTTFFEAGNVLLPHPEHCPWAREYVAELTQFPGAPHDDQVDATTQALRDFDTKRPMCIDTRILRQPRMGLRRIGGI